MPFPPFRAPCLACGAPVPHPSICAACPTCARPSIPVEWRRETGQDAPFVDVGCLGLAVLAPSLLVGLFSTATFGALFGSTLFGAGVWQIGRRVTKWRYASADGSRYGRIEGRPHEITAFVGFTRHRDRFDPSAYPGAAVITSDALVPASRRLAPLGADLGVDEIPGAALALVFVGLAARGAIDAEVETEVHVGTGPVASRIVRARRGRPTAAEPAFERALIESLTAPAESGYRDAKTRWVDVASLPVWTDPSVPSLFARAETAPRPPGLPAALGAIASSPLADWIVGPR